MAGNDLRRGPPAARILAGANRQRTVPAEFLKKFCTPFAGTN
jgi:hypothetical protein